ncbi:MAG TPA: YgaP-like transmembrane domain [Tepidiformaceae bacterium]|nr:YgaP-like transmembrane domain [Tepidiformaceae bacterium]
MDHDSSAANGSPISRFTASGWGRLARIAAGIALIALGLLLVPWPAGLAVSAAGLVPLATGLFNLCPIAPLWGGHFIGARYCARPSAPRTSPRASKDT